MPRNVDPGSIRTGSGKAVPGESHYYLSGVSPTAPAMGDGEYDGPKPPDGGGLAGLDAHVHDPSGAHPASAIDVLPFPDILWARNVQQVVDAQTGFIVPAPTMNGELRLDRDWNPLPCWGALGLRDENLISGADASFLPDDNPYVYPPGVNDPDDVYPYYFTATAPTLDNNDVWTPAPQYDALGVSPGPAPNDVRGGELPAEGGGSELWNVSTVLGGGKGLAHAGAFTDTITGGVVRTTCAAPLQTGSVAPFEHFQVCLTGCAYPADRGVLALVHWPHDGDVAAFLAQDLLDRVVAALLLGQGITGGDCIRWDPSVGAPTVCDGDPGGIFAVGTDENGNYNPMAYPGQATGQYNLNEIHTGISTIAPEQLPPPWNDFDGDGTVGAPREPNSELPAPGQVRLGTVAAAVSGEAPVLPYGIPILGATHDAYEDYLIHAGTVDSHYAIGKTFIETSNFFSYRLPVLSSYWPRSGLRHTPKGVDPLSTKETARYFFPETPYDNTQSDLVYELADSPGDWRLHTAGAYTWGRSLFEDETDFPYTDGEEEPSDQDLPFSQDGWFWQIARYRHSFYVEDGDTVGAKGTFWFFHFKTEEDFEKFARDGIMPWDATDGYELYGAHPNGEAIEDYANLVNEDPGTGVNPHEAPEYGYRGLGYFLNKSSVYLADSDDQDDIAFANHVWQWTDGGVTMMRSSGVAHFNPMDIAAGVPLFTISTLNAQVNGGGAADPWTAVYRVDDNPLTGAALPPARVSSPNPAFLYVGHFSYDEDAGAPTMTVPPAFAVPRNVRKQRIEFPYDYLGAFNEANGPDFADNLTMQLGLGETIRPDGDTNYPAFSMNARPRAFVRRPLAHEDWEDAVQPSYVAGTGAGQACVAVDTREVLFHSTVFTVGAGAGNGPYGNFITGAPNSPAYASLGTALKDTEERFLDEVYRIHQGFGGMAAGVGGDQLRGPGMQGWVAGFISTPIRVGHTIDATWIPASWVQTGTHDDNNCLNNNPFELQVGGLPDRNPPLSDWVKYAMPSSGILQYPKVDYTAGYAPDLASEGVTQPDYSACAGTRSFTRALDVAFENSGTAEAVEGTVFVTLRIDGIRLEDFAYTAPGPGHTANGIAVLVKVPGLTTWMDLGRPDGGGPGKQDPVLDGAGCKVSGQYTYDYIDRETGVAYCQVVANVGPVAALQKNSDDTVPVLVRVVMRDAPALSSNYDFNHEYNSDTSTWTGTTGPGISSRFVRGIVGLRLIRESQKAEKPAA